jgi:hypothetical protein
MSLQVRRGSRCHHVHTGYRIHPVCSIEVAVSLEVKRTELEANHSPVSVTKQFNYTFAAHHECAFLT